MIKKVSILFIIGFAPLLLRGQNLISNGSFEEPVNPCPQVFNFPLITVTGWYTPSWNTPDLFASCAPPLEGGQPQTNKGYQPAKIGSRMAGSVYYPFNRDYLTNKFIDTLKRGKTYCLTFYINLSDANSKAIPFC